MNVKNSGNYVKLAILASMLIGSMILMPLSSAFISGHSSVGTNFAVFEGTAGNDSYSSMQYSYLINQWAMESGYYNESTASKITPGDVWFNASDGLRIGMTEYGEFVTPDHAGIAYGANSEEWNLTESWSTSNPAIPAGLWIQGWVLAVNYTAQSVRRSLFAYALYSNLTSTPELGRGVYSWNGSANPSWPTAHLLIGTLQPTGIQVLYDSARLAIARATVIITDPYIKLPFAQVTLTLVFNKDRKYAIVYKDVKILLAPKTLDKITDFTFSERYELDLASWLNLNNGAYAHYYGNYSTSAYYHPLTNSSEYDVLQAYDQYHQFIYFAGYWPNATEYSVYATLIPQIALGITTILPIGTRNSSEPVGYAPNTPWVSVQWRYDASIPKDVRILEWLAKSGTEREIRFVEVMGMTNYNKDPQPAMDKQDPLYTTDKYAPELDTEVAYLLNSVFNPADLTNMNDSNFMWVGLGQSSATTDSAAASFVTGALGINEYQPFTMFDRNDTMFPWTGGITMQGTIPYGLTSFGGNYYQTFSNTGTHIGSDSTSYVRTSLQKFAFGVYDDVIVSPPQPIAGGWSNYSSALGYYYWYPSKNPLSERWTYSGTSWNKVGYDLITNNPNGIITLGGPKADGLTRYFNDFGYAIQREGTSNDALIRGGTVTGSAPTSNPNLGTLDYFPVSSWATNQTTFGYGAGYAVISLATDVNGTRGLSIYGWNGRDTYWASAWASQYILGSSNSWIPHGTVAVILHITYSSGSCEPIQFTVVKALGTITEMGINDFAVTNGYTWRGTIQTTAPAAAGYIPPYPTQSVWWFAKLPTTSTAKVQFDP